MWGTSFVLWKIPCSGLLFFLAIIGCEKSVQPQPEACLSLEARAEFSLS